MKLLYISNGAMAEEMAQTAKLQEADHEVSRIDLEETQDYAAILAEIKAADQVISVQNSGVAQWN